MQEETKRAVKQIKPNATATPTQIREVRRNSAGSLGGGVGQKPKAVNHALSPVVTPSQPLSVGTPGSSSGMVTSPGPIFMAGSNSQLSNTLERSSF